MPVLVLVLVLALVLVGVGVLALVPVPARECVLTGVAGACLSSSSSVSIMLIGKKNDRGSPILRTARRIRATRRSATSSNSVTFSSVGHSREYGRLVRRPSAARRRQ